MTGALRLLLLLRMTIKRKRRKRRKVKRVQRSGNLLARHQKRFALNRIFLGFGSLDLFYENDEL